MNLKHLCEPVEWPSMSRVVESFDSGDQAQISSATWRKSQWAGNPGSSIPEWAVIGYLNLRAAILTRLLI